jgi:hypothetical protein
MAAGKHGSAEITIAYDDAPGGTLRTVTSFVLTMGAVKISSGMQANTPYGASVEGMLPTGVSKIDQITVRGFWDDTPTTGPHTVFLTPDSSPQASTRTLQIGFGNSKLWSSEGFLVSYAVIGKAGNLTEFEAVLQQNSGAWS